MHVKLSMKSKAYQLMFSSLRIIRGLLQKIETMQHSQVVLRLQIDIFFLPSRPSAEYRKDNTFR